MTSSYVLHGCTPPNRTSPNPYAKNRNGRDAVTEVSSWRMEPAAALRGLANVLRFSFRNRSLSKAKSLLRKMTSPRTSRRSGASPCSTLGRLRTVCMASVTSSPTSPSPRVRASTNRPFSYTSSRARPSIFGSHQKACSSPSWALSRRLRKPCHSSASNTLSRLYIRRVWALVSSDDNTCPPILFVGESGDRHSGCRSSSLRSS